MSAESPSKAGDEVAAMKAYTDGKMMRFNLLFSVNGGAFAIARVLFGENSAGPNSPRVLGGLSLQALAIGMSVFTFFMCLDLWVYGAIIKRTIYKDAFGWPGKVVVSVIGFLLICGWLLAAFEGGQPAAKPGP